MGVNSCDLINFMDKRYSLPAYYAVGNSCDLINFMDKRYFIK